MSAQIISFAEFRGRREQATASGRAVAVGGIDRPDLATASRVLAASVELARQQALLLSRTRARHALCRRDRSE